jgi:1-deoxy-D-xylulose-5-phosphate reductoisomerase
MQPKRLVILGSTGSIGQQTLDILRSFPEQFEVVGLCAGNNVELLKQQVDEFHPRYINSVAELPSYNRAKRLPAEEIVSLPEVDMVMAATVGCAGMGPTLAAIDAGKTVALANKEVIVMAGELLMMRSRQSGATILPVDSEPSALWQCIQGEQGAPAKFIITASGGAFRGRTWESLHDVSPAEALKHPTWTMGAKITIDSATLMNKAFEVIETRWLFDIPYEQIDVVIHRQSIIHSMVEFADGSVKAQLGPPDMRHPIQYALFYPDRQENSALPHFNPVQTGSLTFEAMDQSLYPCFELALEYGKRGGTWPSALAGADEAAVSLFLDGVIRFMDIPDVVANTLASHRPIMEHSVKDATEVAAWAAEQTLSRYSARARIN